MPQHSSVSSDELARQILQVVALIPYGKVASYGQIAKLAGLPKHARLVGYVLKHLVDDAKIPWHRVINSQGKISLSKLDDRGDNIQRLKLLEEGVMVIGVLSLGIMGALASYAGGVSIWRGSVRVMLWGIIAMLFSSWIGSLFNVSVA